MVISQREKCTFAAGALAPVPIGLKTIAWPSWYHLKPCKRSPLLALPLWRHMSFTDYTTHDININTHCTAAAWTVCVDTALEIIHYVLL